MSTLTRTRRTAVPMADGTPATEPDDVFADDTLTAAWVRAVALAASTAARKPVPAHANDLWHGTDAEVHSFIAANPAF